MAIIPIHSHYALNSELKPVNEFQPEESNGSVYEVLRIVRGVPLFLEDHLKRLIHSVELAGLNLNHSERDIEEILLQLIQTNKVFEGNILISFKTYLLAYFIPHKYPGRALYQNGIRMGILNAERDNPNAKVFQTTVRQKAEELKRNSDYYEVLLVDQLNRITEGSSSNVFFVDGNKLITAPASEVLLGITRDKAILLAHELNIEVEERSIYLKELTEFEAAFITGTSPKILPVNQINNIQFNAENTIIMALIKAYDDLIEEYVSAR